MPLYYSFIIKKTYNVFHKIETDFLFLVEIALPEFQINYPLSQIFVNKLNLQNIEGVKKEISEIKRAVFSLNESHIISSEIEAIKICGENAELISLIDDNWNDITPNKLRFISSYEVLKLFEDWLEFLLLQERMCYVPKEWLRDDIVL